MPVRLFALWNQQELSILQPFRFALRDPSPADLNKIVSGIIHTHLRRNFFQLRRRIVIREAFT